MTAKTVVFAIAPGPLLVLVALVCRDDDDGPHTVCLATGFQHVGRAHDVGRPGFQRLAVGTTDEWLGSKMENNLRPGFRDCRRQRRGIANVETAIFSVELQQIPMVRVGCRIQCDAGNRCAQLLQPKREPTTLETGVARKQYSPAPVDTVEQSHSQDFQGALPDDQRSSNWFLSRRVSMGCQKPRCSKASKFPSPAKASRGPASQAVRSSAMYSST